MTIPNYLSQRISPNTTSSLSQNLNENTSLPPSLTNTPDLNHFFYSSHESVPSISFQNNLRFSNPIYKTASSELDSIFLSDNSVNQHLAGLLMTQNGQNCIECPFASNKIVKKPNHQNVLLLKKKIHERNPPLIKPLKIQDSKSSKDSESSKNKKSFQKFRSFKKIENRPIKFMDEKEYAEDLKFTQKDKKHAANYSKDVGSNVQCQIHQDELKFESPNQTTHTLLNKRSLIKMLSSDPQTTFQNADAEKSRKIIPQSSALATSEQSHSSLKSKLQNVKPTSSFKKLCIDPSSNGQKNFYALPLDQSHIQYPQLYAGFAQNSPTMSSRPNEMFLNTSQVSFGNFQQNPIFLPATFQMPNKNMAQMMVPNMGYPGAQNISFQGNGLPQNNSYIIVMNQPTIIANQPITVNIQNNYNTAPPQYQQAPTIQHITNMYCPNSNNNVFTSDSWQN